MRTWCMGVLLLCSSTALFSAELNKITVSQQKDRTILYFTVNGPFTHKMLVLPNPERLVIDFKATQLKVALNQSDLRSSLIKQVRSGQPDPSTIRLVFDLNRHVTVQSSAWLPKEGTRGIRIDLLHAALPMAPVKGKTAAVYKPQAKPVQWVGSSTPRPKPIIPIHQPLQRLRDVVVVLDAGHGGKDPGAHGPRNSKEKDVVLSITLRLKRLIDSQPGMRAVLTRTGDYYVGLRQRLDIARKYNGDIFVSIHADAFNNPHSNGASVFALSQGGATSEAARWLAEKENYSELGGVNLDDLDDRNGIVRSVLIDLSQTATINAGLQMGGRVLGQLGSFTTLHNMKVEQARFMVLKSPDIPSILVETGFISNPREERNLTSPAYQDRLSRAVFQGIKGYFWDNPPHGSRIEALSSTRFHMVKSGDNIPSIATHYRVSIASLQAVNRLDAKKSLVPGQKLVIPSA